MKIVRRQTWLTFAEIFIYVAQFPILNDFYVHIECDDTARQIDGAKRQL